MEKEKKEDLITEEKIEELEEKVKKNSKRIWWLTIVMILLLIAFFGFGYAMGLTKIASQIQKADTEVEKNDTGVENGTGQNLEVTDSVKAKTTKFIKAAITWRSTGSTREHFIKGTTSLPKNVKLEMTTAAIFTENKVTEGKELSDEEIAKLSGEKPGKGEKVRSVKVADYNAVYKELFNEEAKYEFSELQSTGCPSPMAINNETQVMYLFSNCGGTTAASYEEKITSYNSDKEYIYVHQELKETDGSGSVTTTKLVWKFDSKLNFVSTTVE